MINSQTALTKTQIDQILTKGSRFIAPLWSLENFVAVNVYMGMTDLPFSKAMNNLSLDANTAGTLPTSFYLEAFKNGRLIKNDVAKALENNEFGIAKDADEFLIDLYDDIESPEQNIKTMADVAGQFNGKKWSRFMVDRISFWASAYFDDKQAVWDTAKNRGSLFGAWKKEAEIDFATEVMGLDGFRSFLSILPNNHLDAAALALEELQIPEEMMDHYLNSLLMKMNGWAGFASRIDWDARLKGEDSHALQEFLAIMIVWELALKKLLNHSSLEEHWTLAKSNAQDLIKADKIDESLSKRLILQQAFDIANQREIIQKINEQKPVVKTTKKPKFQAVFCIDVRSEVIRRNMEAANPEIETLGFAGFFAFPINYVPIGHDKGSEQCPVLLTSAHTIKEKVLDDTNGEKTEKRRMRKMQNSKAIKAFKQGAISCFGFVSPLGMYFLPKLLSDSFSRTRPIARADKFGLSKSETEHLGVDIDFDSTTGIPLEDQINMGFNALKAMSLNDELAPVVLITGHGSNTTNNPHASGLDCGACGGNSGEANAKVAAAVLNNPKVREGLKVKGLHVTDTTLFIAALHNTTSDEVTLFKGDSIYHSVDHDTYINELNYSLKLAGEKSRAERGERMGIVEGDVQNEVLKRSKDWSQVRPEWGLAGCSSFIVAPRERTSQLNFGGKSFMHNYAWEKDKDFGILELIMTAPMVVTSWINLQYYASTVDNKVFGAGNKTLHNVVGGIGVLEGFSGDLRVGLPMQSVNDGKKFQHEPQRLNVIIEAPVDEMSKILNKHDSIKQLCDNEWIYLFAMNKEGKVAYKYIGDLQWEVI